LAVVISDRFAFDRNLVLNKIIEKTVIRYVYNRGNQGCLNVKKRKPGYGGDVSRRP
jgi:hypothetical protein